MKRMRAARYGGVIALLVTMACGGDSAAPPRPAVVTVTPSSLSLRPGATASVSATVLDERGRPLTGHPVTWLSSDPSVAPVVSTGLITAVGVGNAVITARSGTASGVAAVEVVLPRVARLQATSPSVDLVPGTTGALSVVAVDESGAPITGWPVSWSSDDPLVATVSAVGIVQGVSAGTTVVRARVDTVSAAFSVRVFGSLDVALTGLSFAQVVQNAAGTVPLLRGAGLPVAVNVYAESPAGVVLQADLEVECVENGATRWTASARFNGVLPRAASAGSPAVQFQMPNVVLGGSLQCHAMMRPSTGVADADLANNRYPATGSLAVPVIDVPALEIAFVPIVLASDGGVVGNVSSANVEEYLITARQLLPLARVNPRVVTPYTTTTAFGNGTDAAWRAILREVDAKRIVDGFAGHYYGVLRPRSGVTSVQFGGFAFIGGRAAVSVQVGWFNREAAARETVAHELGHNFGRPHAPCGGPANPDPGYPYLDAAIGAFGWDVFGVRDDPSRAAPSVAPGTKDLMSYCRPIWISDYNYLRMIDGRETLSGLASSATGRALLVRGEFDATGIRLDPLFEVEGQGPPTDDATVDLEVLGPDGAVLARAKAGAQAVDHSSTQSFVTLVPLPGAPAASRLRVTAGTHRLEQPLLDADAASVGAVTVDRAATGARVRWNAAVARHALVRDAITGEVLAIADGGLVTLPGPPARRLSISLSGGGGRLYRPAPR